MVQRQLQCVVQPAARALRAPVSGAVQVGGGQPGRVGSGLEPVCAFEPGPGWAAGVGQKRAAEDARGGVLGARGPSVGAIEGPGGVGGEEFLENLRRHVVGNAREQRGVRRLAVACPTLSEVIASVEKVKGESWGEFRDRHGDSGRDLVLYLGRRRCGLKLQELAGAAGMTDYRTVSIAIRRFEKRLRRSKVDQEQFEQVCQLSNIEM
jgi:hypothetical protein